MWDLQPQAHSGFGPRQVLSTSRYFLTGEIELEQVWEAVVLAVVAGGAGAVAVVVVIDVVVGVGVAVSVAVAVAAAV